MLLLQQLLGLQPDRRQHTLRSVASGELPTWAGLMRISGIRAFDRVWDVRVDDRLVKVEERGDPLRIAVIAPPWFAVPPTGYGGIELVVSLLADGLVEAGHDVTSSPPATRSRRPSSRPSSRRRRAS